MGQALYPFDQLEGKKNYPSVQIANIFIKVLIKLDEMLV